MFRNRNPGSTGPRSWLLVSDNEDQETYPPVPWPEDAIVRGAVMWTRRTL